MELKEQLTSWLWEPAGFVKYHQDPAGSFLAQTSPSTKPLPNSHPAHHLGLVQAGLWHAKEAALPWFRLMEAQKGFFIIFSLGGRKAIRLFSTRNDEFSFRRCRRQASREPLQPSCPLPSSRAGRAELPRLKARECGKFAYPLGIGCGRGALHKPIRNREAEPPQGAWANLPGNQLKIDPAARRATETGRDRAPPRRWRGAPGRTRRAGPPPPGPCTRGAAAAAGEGRCSGTATPRTGGTKGHPTSGCCAKTGGLTCGSGTLNSLRFLCLFFSLLGKKFSEVIFFSNQNTNYYDLHIVFFLAFVSKHAE